MVFYSILPGKQTRRESDWLHQHPTPRPFTLVPLYSADGYLAGMRLSALTEQAASLFQRTGDWFSKRDGRAIWEGGLFVGESRYRPEPTGSN